MSALVPAALAASSAALMVLGRAGRRTKVPHGPFMLLGAGLGVPLAAGLAKYGVKALAALGSASWFGLGAFGGGHTLASIPIPMAAPEKPPQPDWMAMPGRCLRPSKLRSAASARPRARRLPPPALDRRGRVHVLVVVRRPPRRAMRKCRSGRARSAARRRVTATP